MKKQWINKMSEKKPALPSSAFVRRAFAKSAETSTVLGAVRAAAAPGKLSRLGVTAAQGPVAARLGPRKVEDASAEQYGSSFSDGADSARALGMIDPVKLVSQPAEELPTPSAEAIRRHGGGVGGYLKAVREMQRARE